MYRLEFDRGSNISSSTIRSTIIHDLNGSRLTHLHPHALPPICQPILTKYRSKRYPILVLTREQQTLFCFIFGINPARSPCLCDKTQHDHYCSLIIKWIQQCYDWKHDSKFRKAYQNYNRKKIDTFLPDADISTRVNKKLQLLGVQINQECRGILTRVIRNYIKHTIYYSKADQLTKENDIYFWLAIGIFYHVGYSENKEEDKSEQFIFWALDIVMNSLEDVSKAALHRHSKRAYELILEYFPNWNLKLVNYGIMLEPIIQEWVNELMMGFMNIEAIGFFADCLIRVGWNYVYKIILSFFDKKLEKMEKEEVFQSISDRQVILKMLMENNEEWPMIFCNANSFVFDRNSTQTIASTHV